MLSSAFYQILNLSFYLLWGITTSQADSAFEIDFSSFEIFSVNVSVAKDRFVFYNNANKALAATPFLDIESGDDIGQSSTTGNTAYTYKSTGAAGESNASIAFIIVPVKESRNDSVFNLHSWSSAIIFNRNGYLNNGIFLDGQNVFPKIEVGSIGDLKTLSGDSVGFPQQIDTEGTNKKGKKREESRKNSPILDRHCGLVHGVLGIKAFTCNEIAKSFSLATIYLIAATLIILIGGFRIARTVDDFITNRFNTNGVALGLFFVLISYSLVSFAAFFYVDYVSGYRLVLFW